MEFVREMSRGVILVAWLDFIREGKCYYEGGFSGEYYMQMSFPNGKCCCLG